MSARRPLAPPRRAQRGVSLIIAMLMLVVIGLASAAIIRNATSADRAVNNNRLQTQANQFAQVALKFCESQVQLFVTAQPTVVNVRAPNVSPAYWTVKANWFNPGITHTLSSGEMSGATMPKVFPQCMAEQAGANPKIFIVTARGFSDDFTEDTSDHSTISGSVIWLQSTIQVG